MFPPTISASWSGEQLRRLRELAAESVPIETIAMLLRRTPSAIRNKAAMHGISLRARTWQEKADCALRARRKTR
jgi:hypothetical protein